MATSRCPDMYMVIPAHIYIYILYIYMYTRSIYVCICICTIMYIIYIYIYLLSHLPTFFWGKKSIAIYFLPG